MLMTGGRAENISIQDIADMHGITEKDVMSQLIIGVDIEMEHTSDNGIAYDIALDHLVEIPDYYDRLVKMESEALNALKK